MGKNFFLCYSPERIDPGQEKLIKKTEYVNITKLISGHSKKCLAKIRSTQKESSGVLNVASNKAEFTFDKEISTTSPGQACVFYLQDQVLGGGWITKTSN